MALVLLTLLSDSFAFVPKTPPQTDWLEAELTIRGFPSKNIPSPDLSPAQVATSCLRSLQFVDYPNEGAGFQRIYPYLTWQCLRAVTCKDSVDCERFAHYAALSPTLQPLFGATRIELHEKECTVIASTKTRGEMRSYPVTVHGAEVLALQHKSGMMRENISTLPPRVDLVIRLEQARRPPLTDCWLITDIINTSYAKGGLGWSRHEGV